MKRSKAEVEGTVGVTVALWWQPSSVFPSGIPVGKQLHWRGSLVCKILLPPCGDSSEVSRYHRGEG